MNTQLIIEYPSLRKIKNDKLEINFFTKTDWNENDIIEKKTDAGYIKVSSPELTVLDLIYYHKRIGGINRTLPIIEELAEEINPQKLYEIAQGFKNNTTIQRLGFLFDEIFNETTLAKSLYKSVENKTTNKVLLSSLSEDKGKINKKWNIVINIDTDY
jgi:predicted transcriptional regulator of viral defense system